jgi:hypothetical protein
LPDKTGLNQHAPGNHVALQIPANHSSFRNDNTISHGMKNENAVPFPVTFDQGYYLASLRD